MNNYYIIFLATIASLQICTNVATSQKIDCTLDLINAELVSYSITEKSKLEAFSYNDVSFLAIDHHLLMSLVDEIMNKNLSFLQHEEKYYFYDSVSKASCKIGEYYCNSVQMKITINYQKKQYEGTLRYEPIQK